MEIGANVVNQSEAAKITCDPGVLLKTQSWTAKKLNGVIFNMPFYTCEYSVTVSALLSLTADASQFSK